VKGAVRVGEERVAAHAGEQPDRTRLDSPGAGIEADRGAGDEHVSGGLGLASLGAGGVIGGPGLRAVLELGEHERERGVGLCVPVGVDVDAVDPVGVEWPGLAELATASESHSGRSVAPMKSLAGTLVPEPDVGPFRAGSAGRW
jgi:hypothetical protein